MKMVFMVRMQMIVVIMIIMITGITMMRVFVQNYLNYLLRIGLSTNLPM
jgi:hypothetical protein